VDQDTVADETTDELAAYMAAYGAELLERLNGDFEDSLVFAARVLTSRTGARAAAVTAIDARGADVVVTDGAGRHTERLAFAEALTGPAQLTAGLFGLVARAREVSGEPGQTSAERELAEMSAIRTFVTRVVAVADVHPHLRRITFGGGDLTRFAPLGPDTFLYVLLPPPGADGLTIDRSFTWEAYAAMPPHEQPVGAYYTVRAWRPEVAELDMLFVLHDVGHAGSWAARAEPGDPVALWGPRSAYHPPADVDWVLLVADETGLPAVAGILEQLPADVPALVVAEVADAAEHQDLPMRPGTDVTWLHRDGASAGTTTLLADAVAASVWPDGTPYVWGGGESHAMTAVRRHVRDARGLDRTHVSLVAYWRHTAD
jgi:NADPH-dependent ferric siderophore reductase